MALDLETFSAVRSTTGVVALLLVYAASRAIFRLYFHPLAKVPGPRLAALSYWYETYYDVFKSPGGQYWHKLEELHKEYGPIIRINPDEVQIHDPEFYDQIYVSGATKRHRYSRANNANGSPGSMASTVSHDLHRVRRNSLNPFFSKAAVSRFEARIQSQVKVLCQRLASFMDRGEIVDMGVAMTSLTMDVITEYCERCPFTAA